jgi:hypothetical protein
MYDLWKSNIRFNDAGFEVFKSPITDERSILLIGYNPNYTDSDIKEDQETGEVYHKNLHGYPEKIATRELTHLEDDSVNYPHKSIVKRCIFGNNSELLSEVVEMNRYFLRSNSKKSHRSILSNINDSDVVQAYEDFCYETNKEVLEKVDPDAVVIMAKDLDMEMIQDWGYDISVTKEYTATDINYSDSRSTDRISSSVKIGETDSFNIISLGNHLSYRSLGNTHYDLFSNIIPKHLPEM